MSTEVLFIDDDADVRQAYGQALELHGLSVILNRALIEAVDHLSPSFPGVVVTDVRMPGKDGFDVLERVKRIDPGIPVIVLTGEGDIPMAVRAVEEGAFAFLEKPCPPAQLVERVEAAGAARQATLAARRQHAAEFLGAALPQEGTLNTQLEALEYQIIIGALKAAEGHVPSAAHQLGLPKKTLYDKLKRHRIDAGSFRDLA